MFYTVSDATFPLDYLESGKVIRNDGFVHPQRSIDYFIFLYVQEGTLHIQQAGKEYALAPGQFLTISPGNFHGGTAPSQGRLVFYWVHFFLKGPSRVYESAQFFQFLRDSLDQMQLLRSGECSYYPLNTYIFSEYGALREAQRADVLCSQMLDIANQGFLYSKYHVDYALSLLMLECTRQCLLEQRAGLDSAPPIILKVVSWIRSNSMNPLSVQAVADYFSYNPRYLTTLFKRVTGYSILAYIRKVRIDNAKSLLVNQNMLIRSVALDTGFTDEKAFMKAFKQVEGITPTQYRNTFYKKQYNSDEEINVE